MTVVLRAGWWMRRQSSEGSSESAGVVLKVGPGVVQTAREPTSSGEGAVEGDTTCKFPEHTGKGAPAASLTESCFHYFCFLCFGKIICDPSVTSIL